MDRWTWMTIRMYVPAAGVLLLSFTVTVPIALMQNHAILAGIAQVARWGAGAAMVAGILLATLATFRLRQWECGKASLTCSCGGLLGRERDGRYGIYRKCLACSRNVNQRHFT